MRSYVGGCGPLSRGARLAAPRPLVEGGRLRLGGTAAGCAERSASRRGALGRSGAVLWKRRRCEVAGGLAFPSRSGTLRGAPRSCGSGRHRQGLALKCLSPK